MIYPLNRIISIIVKMGLFKNIPYQSVLFLRFDTSVDHYGME